MARLLLLFVTLLAVSCTINNIPANYSLDNTTDKGVVVFSISQSFSGSAYNWATSYWLDKQNTKSDGIYDYNFVTPSYMRRKQSDFGEQEDLGTVHAIALPEGEYAFVRWVFGAGLVEYYSATPLPKLRFTVTSGEITYLGNLHMVLNEQTHKPKTNPDIRNYFPRDSKVFEQKWPHLRGELKLQLLPQGRWE